MAVISSQSGINLTSSKLQLIEIGWIDDEIVVENADEELLQQRTDKKLSEQDLISLIQSAYDKIVARHPLKSRTVSFTLPTHLFEIAEIPIDDLLTKEDLAAHLNWEFSVLYPSKDPSELLLRYFEIGAYDYPNSKKILAAAIEKKILSAIHKFCISNKLNLRLVDNVHFAANLLIRPEAGVNNYVSLYSDDDTLTMMIFEKGKPKSFEILDTVPMAGLSAKIINMYEKFYRTGIEPGGLKNIFVSGETFSDETVEMLDRGLNYCIRRMAPFGNLKASPLLFNKALIVSKFHAFAAPIGIAARIS